MADDLERDRIDEALRERQNRMSGQTSRRLPRIGTFAFLAALLLIALFLIFPDQARRLLGFDTSQSADIQTASEIDNSGISTQFQGDPPLVIETPPPVEILPPPARSAGLDEEAARRLAELEEALGNLANRPSPSGPTSEDIQRLLDQQAAALAADAEAREQLLQAQLEALRSQLSVPQGLTAEQLAEQERLRLEAEEEARLRQLLEQRKAEREAELAERRLSDGNVFDEGEVGGSSSGSQDDKTGIRELSQNEQFLETAADRGFQTAQASQIQNLSKTIVQGTLIAAILETAINTELPGNIRAQVMQPVYSYDGQSVLMPAGTRLIGAYNPEISIAQKRVLIAWNRAITPDGQSVTLAATGVDRLGRGGQAGNVDSRFAQRFGTAVLITSISAIPSFLASDDAGGGTFGKAATGVAQDASDDLADATEDALGEYLKLPPIIRIPQGTPMNVFVNQDLVFL